MDASKQQYLQQLRAGSAYPTYRGIIGIVVMLHYVLAGVVALAAVVELFRGLFLATLALLVAAAILFVLARFFKEASLILVDMGDSLLDFHARGRDTT